MIALTLVLTAALGFCVGSLCMLTFLTVKLIDPLRKQRNSAVRGWEETIELAKVLANSTTDDAKSGNDPILSPLQIKN
jgi:hypothetical protein